MLFGLRRTNFKRDEARVAKQQFEFEYDIPFGENRIYVTSSDLISENLHNRNAQDHIYVAGATYLYRRRLIGY